MKAKAAGADELTQGQRENENGCTLRKQQPLRDGRRMRNNTGRGAAGETRGAIRPAAQEQGRRQEAGSADPLGTCGQ